MPSPISNNNVTNDGVLAIHGSPTFQLQGLCVFESCRWRGLGGRAWGGVCHGGLGRKWVEMSANDGFSTTTVEA